MDLQDISFVTSKHFYCLLVFSIFKISAGHACRNIELKDPNQECWIVRSFVEIFVDISNKCTIDEVGGKPFASRFHQARIDPLVNSNPEATYWLKFTAKNISDRNTAWLLEYLDHDVNLISFYTANANGGYEQIKAGNTYNFKNRFLQHKNFVFPLNIDTGQTKTFYLQFKTSTAASLEPVIKSYQKFISYALCEYILLGLFYGLMFTIVLYNFFLFINLRLTVYLYYILYIFGVCIFTLCNNGMGFQYLWNAYPNLNSYLPSVSLCLSSISSLLFVRTFFSDQPISSKTVKVLYGIIFARILLLILALTLIPALMNYYYADVVLFLFTFFIGIHSFVKGNRSAFFYLAANTSLLTGLLVTLFEIYGFITSSVFTVYSLNIAMVVEMAFLSYALAHQLKSALSDKESMQQKAYNDLLEFQKIKDEINVKLKIEVALRTEELRHANHQLELKAAQITAANIQLDLVNNTLKKNIAEVSLSSVTRDNVGLEEFASVFPDSLSCYRYLQELKGIKNFSCKKCTHNSFSKGRNLFDRRCNKCGYNESVTSNTLFHKAKFPIEKAFYILYLFTSTASKITAEEVSFKLGMRKGTCQLFMRKIKEQLKGRKEFSWERLILDCEIQEHKHALKEELAPAG